jgi:hypothetical protein
MSSEPCLVHAAHQHSLCRDVCDEGSSMPICKKHAKYVVISHANILLVLSVHVAEEDKKVINLCSVLEKKFFPAPLFISCRKQIFGYVVRVPKAAFANPQNWPIFLQIA